MVDFVHPFPGKNPGDPLTNEEIIRALRLSLCAEEEATQLYDLIAEYVDDKRISKIMKDVANEEQVHKGEFQKLIDIFVDDEETLVEEGKQEAEEKMSSTIVYLKKLATDLIKVVSDNLAQTIVNDLNLKGVWPEFEKMARKYYRKREELDKFSPIVRTRNDIVPKELEKEFDIHNKEAWLKHRPDVVNAVIDAIKNQFVGYETEVDYKGIPASPSYAPIERRVKEAEVDEIHNFDTYQEEGDENYRLDIHLTFKLEEG